MGAPDRVLTVADERHFFLVRDELDAVHPALADGILLEPLGRNTAAALAYAAIVTEERWPGAVLWAMPADPVIEDEAALADAHDHAADPAEAGWQLASGHRPARPEPASGSQPR